MSLPVEAILSALNKVRRSGKGWVACCPAHDDRTPSLSITEGDDGRALLHCYGGCDVRSVVEAAGLKMTDLFPEGMSLEARQQYQRRSMEAARDHARLLVEIAQNTAGELSDDDLLVAAKARYDLPGIEARLAELQPPADSTPFGHSAHADPDTCSTIIRTGSRSAATQRWHC